MRLFYRLRGLIVLLTLATGLSLVATDFAEARRGGSFGSRGARTFSAPSATRTTPTTTQPVQRSMTPQSQQSTSGATSQAGTAANAGRRGGMFGGMAGGLLGGLMLGGLIGMLMGNGLGGMAGFLGLLLQIGIGVLIISLVMRFFRGQKNNRPAFAGGSSGPVPMNDTRFEAGSGGAGMGSASRDNAVPPIGGGAAPSGGGDEIGLTAEDFDQFEQLLAEIQAAFAREDYAGLRERCTPEIVSFLSEELSQNAVDGKRNEVTDVSLLQGDLSEAWREGDQEYATVAMRYQSVDIMRDRQTGEVLEGSAGPTETTEVWTFVRPVGGAWKLSAIQE